jgi:hypothetical protein
MFGDLLAQIQNSNKESYIFIDANLNLLDLNCAENQNYLNLLFASGFLQGIVKATRIQNLSKSLINHILFNKIANNVASGVLISDVSDHFFTFICPQTSKSPNNTAKMSVSRDFSLPCLTKFKNDLRMADWHQVLASNCVAFG